MRIDLNSDLGEGFGPYAIADDAGIMKVITSANLACGYHAGDPVIMDKTVALAEAANVDVGAHVGYPDRMGFGRRNMDMDLGELEKHVIYQLGALEGFARIHGRKISHMNPHGALGNLACADRSVADALVRATSAFDPDIAYLVLSGTELETAARAAGRRTINLFLADRAYQANGQLAPRTLPGAVIKDEAAAVKRILRLLDDGSLETLDGQTIRIDVQSILVHSDTPGALQMAQGIRAAITGAGGVITPLSQLLA